jgi:phosphohistidine phosphatase SixA
MRIYLVRHAHAGSKKAWTGDDRLRPLDGRGRRQAEALSRALAKTKVTRILSSPYIRCLQTVEPLAAPKHLVVEPSPALAADGGPAALALVHEIAGSEAPRAVLCTHREVLVQVLPELSAQFGVRLGHRLPGAKASTWLLDFRQAKLTAVRYLAPPR